MAKKQETSQENKLQNQDWELFPSLEAIDRKDYAWWDKLSPEQQRKFVAYMMIHWCSSVTASGDVARYWVLSTNHHANMHMFNEVIVNHPQLQWLMLCASSPGLGKARHAWVPHLSPRITQLRDSAKMKEVQDYFTKIYPSAAPDDIKQYSAEYTRIQNHRQKLATMMPELKYEDIELLADIVTDQDIVDYEKNCGY